MEQSISKPTDREFAWISQQLDVAAKFFEAFSPSDAGKPLSLAAVDRAFAAWLASGESDSHGVNAAINCVGVAFGQFLLANRPFAFDGSCIQVICHLADSEIVYADRIKRVLAEDNPTFFEADPNRFRPALFCVRRPLDRELDVVDAVRAHLHPILRSCDADAFQRTGVHSLDGSMTLQTLLERITAHIPHHIAFIEEKLQAMTGWLDRE